MFRTLLLWFLVFWMWAVSPARADQKALIQECEALSSQLHRTFGVSLVCGCPLDDRTDNSGYYISRTLYAYDYESRLFTYFVKKNTDQAHLGARFERLEKIQARIEGMLSANPSCHFLGCTLRKSFDKVKAQLSRVASALGGTLVPPEPDIPDPGTPKDEGAPEPAPSPAPAANPSPAPVEPPVASPSPAAPAPQPSPSPAASGS